MTLGFDPQRLRDRDDRVFGGAVARLADGGTSLPSRRCSRCGPSAADHDRISSLDPVHHALEVHVEDVVPVFERVRVDLAADRDAGVVEEESIRPDCRTASATARSNDG